jgi:hypothetical protein
MSPDTVELVSRAEVVTAESAELRRILEKRLRLMRSLRKSLSTTRATVVTNYERAARPALAGQSDPES